MLDEWTDIYLDDDGNFREASDGDMQVVTGTTAILQDIKHELETVKSSYLFDTQYGSLLINYLQRENTELSRQELIQDVEDTLRRHPSVRPGSIIVTADSWTTREIAFSVTFRLRAANDEQQVGMQVMITVDGVQVVRSD